MRSLRSISLFGLLAFGLCLAIRLAGAGEMLPGDAELRAAVRAFETGNANAAIEALLRLEAAPAAPSVAEGRDFLLGVLLLRQRRGDDAISRLAAAASQPLLADYALVQLAAAYRDGGRRAEAAEALERLWDGHPRSLLRERAGREAARDWLEVGELPKAAAAASRYLAAYQGGASADVWLTLGEALAQLGRTERAEEVFRRLWVETPGSPEAQRAEQRLATLGAPLFSAEERFQRALNLHRLGRYTLAQTELGPFATAGDPHEARARLNLGIGAFQLRKYEQAVRWLTPLTEGSAPERPEGLYWLGRSAGRAGNSAQFEAILGRLADAGPSARAEEGLYILAKAAADDGDAIKARGYLARLLKDYPRGSWRDAALWLEGWLAYKRQESKPALAAWDRLSREEPGSRLRVQGLYWRARILQAEGPRERKDAIKAYRGVVDAAEDHPYYRMRALERLAGLGKPTARPLPRVTAGALTSGVGDRLHLLKARALRSLGLREEALEEYREQVTEQPADREAVIEACAAFLGLERYDRAVWVAKRLLQPLYLQEGKPPIPDYWQCLYPLGYWPLVSRFAKEQSVDPLLVAALIREESAYATAAVSSAGARGLMQVMPQTAERLARENRLPASKPLELPEVNIPLGTLHLAEALAVSGGNRALALAAYNAGKQPVQGWRERLGFRDEEEFIEDIPYAETRGYVKRVLGSYWMYREIYGETPANPSVPQEG